MPSSSRFVSNLPSGTVSEVYGRRKEEVRNGKLRVTTRLEVSWDYRWAVIYELFTSGNPFAPQTSGYLPRAFPWEISGRAETTNSIKPPWSYFDSLYDPNSQTPENTVDRSTTLGFIQASIIPKPSLYTSTDSDSQYIDYYWGDGADEKGWAYIDVVYESRWNIDEEINFNVEYLTMDHRLFRWSYNSGETNGDGLKDDRLVTKDQAPGQPFRNVMITRKFRGLAPFHLRDYIYPYIGRTNGTIFRAASVQFGELDPGTCLIVDPVIRPAMCLYDGNFAGYGSAGWDVDLRLLYVPQGHNVFWRQDGLRPVTLPEWKPEGTIPGPGTYGGVGGPYGGYWDRLKIQTRNKNLVTDQDLAFYEPFPEFDTNDATELAANDFLFQTPRKPQFADTAGAPDYGDL